MPKSANSLAQAKCDPRFGWRRGIGKCVRVEPKEGSSEKDLTENAIILKEHQERVRERLQKQDGLILDHGLGSGKTISAIAAAEDFGGAVVVTPASLRENFKKELRRYQAKGQYDVMSYEEFVRDRPNLVGRMLIVDEAHRLANSSTKRTQAIAEEASKASKRLLLTATPLQNRPSDASTLVNIAAGEKILPVGEADFRRKYLYRVGYVEGAFDNVFRGVPTYGSLKPKNLDEYRRKVSRYVDFYAPNQEGFPTVAKHTVNIPMSKAQARAQEAWLKEMPPDMKQRIKEGRPPESGDISRLNTFMNATRQTANTGGAYGATDEDLSPKVAAIADRIADSKGKALVYSNYIDSGVAPLEKALKQKGISSVRLTGGMSDKDRARIVQDYNDDKFRTLIISSAGGEGLDLKKTEQIHVMEPHWNDEKINQVIGRGVRYKSHEGLPPDRQHVDVYKYVSVFPDEYFLFWNRYKGLKTADEYLSLMSDRKMELNSAFLNSYRRRSDAKKKAKCDPDAGWKQGVGKCVRVKPNPSENKEKGKKSNKKLLPVAILSGAALIGVAPAAYLAFRFRYRAGFAASAAEAEKISFEIENEMRREASNRLGKDPSKLSPEEIFMVVKPDKFDEKGGVLRETVYGVEKDIPRIAFTIGGFHDYGELGYGLANQVGGDLEGHSVFPLTNKELQISPEMTWLPMNEMLAQEVDPDGKGGFVKRGYLSRRGIDETMSRVFGEKEWARIRDEEVRKSSWYQETEPVARQVVRYSSDLKMLFDNATQKHRNPDAVKAAAYAMTAKRLFPDKEIDFVAHSGGGIAAAEALEILKVKGIKARAVVIGTPHFGMTSLSRNELVTIAAKKPFQQDSSPKDLGGKIESVLPSDKMTILPMQNLVEMKSPSIHNWVENPDGEDYKKGKRGYGQIPETYELIRAFFYGEEARQRNEGSKRRKIQARRQSQLRRQAFGARNDSIRLDRRPPAKCDPSRGWKQGTGKCIRVKPVDEESSSSGVFGRKTDITSDRAYHARLGRLGLLGGGVAVTAIVAGVGYQVASDVKKISVKPSEEEDLVDYDSFDPGDLIRKRTSMAGASVYHYAIYAGKDPETGEHKIIHTQAPDADYQNSASVIVRSSIRKKGTPSANPSSSASSSDFDDEGSAYMKVPVDEMYKKKGSKRLSREEILSRAEQAIGSDYTFHVFSSNCETFARGMVEGVSYSSQGDAVSPLTRFLGDTLAKVAASTTKKNYLSNKNRKTSTQLVEYFNSRSEQRKDSKGYQQKTVGLVNVLAATRNENPAQSLVDAYCDQVGIKRPDDYTKLVNELSRPLGTTKKAVQVKMYTDYAKMFFGTLRSQDILGKDRVDSIRLDRRPPAKCDPRFGWQRGAGGKCVRVKKVETVAPRKGEGIAASLGSYEINPDTGRPYKIRELRGIAREKGLVGYGSMTTGQMKSAMRLIDESPEDAQRKNLIKTFSRDRSISSKAIAAGLGNVKGNSPAGRRLIKEVKEANLTFKRFAALMKFASTSPAGWGVLGAAAFLGERTIAQWGKVKDDYRKGLDESAKIAASRVPNVNVRHPTPSNPKGQFFRPSASRATGKKTGSENITFVVSGAASGASRMIEDLRQLGKAPKATEAERWMSRNNFVPIDLKETRVASADGGLDEAVQMMGDFMQNRKRGRNQDAVDLASSLFAHATAYPDKRVNLIAHGAGGLATKEALEILSRMEVKKGNRVIKGKDLVGKFNVVLLGTPHFGYTETVAQNTRTVTSPNDPFSRIPFSGGGMRPQWISSVKGHKPSDYLADPSVREAIRESFGYYRTDSTEERW